MHELAESLGAAIDAKDRFTRAHSDEVAVIAEMLALRLGLSEAEATIVHVAGHLHDIGKIGLPDSVLQKPNSLSPEEWALVRRHPAMGHDILAPVGCLCALGVPVMVLHHHERFDGGGYPHGLSGQGIPLGARIIAVADSLSAMLQARAYRAPMRFDDAMAEVRRCAEGQFDPRVVGALMEMADEARAALAACREALAAQRRTG
ncbi:metal dependent phosphohydrolase [Alkalidesulfovibrio alkalitolerans DSM 16529]|uniref:Metal dependent phosphohydrolase n=2 Tax=Alkalidesulfovibrio alkalitolerans TaxID=293256 RepID=S7TCG0_9BACT|nr:metal dependent phosphohydrolase [Alkalidesulfovibrio alkalitolerans DSM 16529]